MYRGRVFRWGVTTLVAAVAVPCVAFIALPMSLALFYLAFAWEDALFGTAYLYNILPSSWIGGLLLWLVIIGLLLLPLLGNNKKQVLWLAGIAYIVLPIALFSYIGLRGIIDNRQPLEVIGSDPEVVSNIPTLKAGTAINLVKWSPSGNFIAIGAGTKRRYDSDIPKDDTVTIIDVETGESIAQISQALYAFWSSDDRLWVLAEDHWDVYAKPFVDKEQVPLIYEGKANYSLSYSDWDFDPNGQVLAIAERSDDRSKCTLNIWEKGVLVYDVELTPKYDRDDLWGMRVSLSPDGTYLALIIQGGWVAYEQPAPGELWVLEISKRKLRLLYESKTKGWQLADYAVQRLTPSWSQDGSTIVFGDPIFGIEAVDIRSKRVRRISGWDTEMYNVMLSKTGKWIAFGRPPGESNRGEQCNRCVGVLKYGKREIICPPEGHFDWMNTWYDWHPNEDVLALLVNRGGRYRLLLWRVSEPGFQKQ